MKKLIFITLCLLMANMTYALDIVYPKRTNVTINSPTTFFIGSAKDNLEINGEKVNVHPSGGFAHFVNLSDGENVFEIKSNDEILKYYIVRPKTISQKYKAQEFIPYKTEKYLEVTNENSPVRSTPVDAGINRISHLQAGIQLVSDGEESGFYRISLGSKNGWISKSNVKIISNTVSPAQLFDYEFCENSKYFVHKFKLDKKVPFEISEGETFSLNLYNMKDCENSTYTFTFPYSKYMGVNKLYGYSGYFDGNTFVFKIRKFPPAHKYLPLHGVTVTVDAGHGGKEFGAIGCLGDKEKDIVLQISKYLARELKRKGANVIQTRTDDTYLSLQNRLNISNENDSEILLSIHANALPDTMNPLEHQGTSVYYYYEQAKPFAQSVLDEMTKQLGTKNDKVRQESFAMVRNTSALSILIETAYLINPQDNAMLIDTKFQKKCAKAIADGVVKYFK